MEEKSQENEQLVLSYQITLRHQRHPLAIVTHYNHVRPRSTLEGFAE